MGGIDSQGVEVRTVRRIIIHCSATTPHIDIGAEVIRQWHIARGWDDIGYHTVIRRSGDVESGRPLDDVGAHTLGENQDSIGICMVGGLSNAGYEDCNFTSAQWDTLKHEVRWLMEEFGKLTVHGHREFSTKLCPVFDVPAWWNKGK